MNMKPFMISAGYSMYKYDSEKLGVTVLAVSKEGLGDRGAIYTVGESRIVLKGNTLPVNIREEADQAVRRNRELILEEFNA